jgi:CRP/FNR family cyclic AMP-dependent transcriptional regulator
MAVDLLESLPDEERRALWSCMRRCRFTPREIVFREGDPADSLHFVVKGHFSARVTTPTGEYALIANARRSATVAAIDEAETMLLHAEHFARLRREYALVDQLLLEATLREIHRLSDALVDALHVPADRRVLRRLAEVAALWPQGEEIPLSQKDLAQLAGVTRQSANKVLIKAQQAELIQIRRGHVVVLDSAELLKRSQRHA